MACFIGLVPVDAAPVFVNPSRAERARRPASECVVGSPGTGRAFLGGFDDPAGSGDDT